VLLIVLLSLATYRVTRFLIEDHLVVEARSWVLRRLMRLPGPQWLNAKVLYLAQCFYCLSVWVAGGLVLVQMQITSVPQPALMWLAAAGGACAVHGVADADE